MLDCSHYHRSRRIFWIVSAIAHEDLSRRCLLGAPKLAASVAVRTSIFVPVAIKRDTGASASGTGFFFVLARSRFALEALLDAHCALPEFVATTIAEIVRAISD